MTVSSQVDKVTASGNGSATTFSFSPVVIFQSSDITVTKVSGGVETLLVEGVGGANYSVSVAAYPGTGSVTYPATGTDRLAVGEQIIMRRVLTIEQLMALTSQGGYFPDTQEDAFDKLTMIALQQQEQIDRAITVPVSTSASVTLELPLPSASSLIGWASDGLSLVNYVIAAVGSIVASVFSASLLLLANAAAWRVALGLDAAATVASASTTDLGATAGLCVDISGTTTIAGFGTVATGTTRKCRITNASGLTLTHSASLICPGSTSLVLAQFDQFEAESYGGGVWAIIKVQRATGAPTMGWATKATQQTGTDAVLSVTASQQHQHPSALKGFGIVASAGSAVVGGYPGTASSVKNGVGDYTVTHGRTMANTNYPASATTETTGVSASVVSRTQTQLQITVTTTSTGAAIDANVDYWIAGTLA